MRSDPTGSDTYRRRLADLVAPELRAGEQSLAMLPFATVPKLPRAPRVRGRRAKVRFGIRQSWRRYRPLVVTNRRLLVFDSGRTPTARSLLADFPLDDLAVGAVTPGRYGTSVFTLSLPGYGDVPFETGRREASDLEVLQTILVSSPPRTRAP